MDKYVSLGPRVTKTGAFPARPAVAGSGGACSGLYSSLHFQNFLARAQHESMSRDVPYFSDARKMEPFPSAKTTIEPTSELTRL